MTGATEHDFFLGGEGALTPADASVALIIVDGCYLMQYRDQAAGIFYPGHWGVFGGAREAGESAIDALRRELYEELHLEIDAARYFTELAIDFSPNGHGWVRRSYFEVALQRAQLDGLVLGEGTAMRLFEARALLLGERVVPYDAFAIWMHATQRPGGLR
jgi:8-oxo-dGTP pyrophosphatase MutT (NUDIX family)